MKRINLSISEWLGLVTVISGVYSYVYYYRFWDFFGINAYDYFGYIDALQHSIPSFISALGIILCFSLFPICIILFAKNRVISFYRYSSYLARTSFYKKNLKLSVLFLIFVFLSSYLLKWFLRSELFSLQITYIMANLLLCLSITFTSVSFSLYFMLDGIKRGYGIKKSIAIFFLWQMILQIFVASFYLPIINAFYLKAYGNAQAIFKDEGVMKSQRLLGISKEYYIVLDGGRGVVRKIDTLQYVIYNRD